MSSENLYRCIRCLKLFTHKNDFRRHINRKFKCEIIGKNNTPKLEESFTCPKCNKTYSSKTNLNRHITGFCKMNNLMNNFTHDVLEDEDIYTYNIEDDQDLNKYMISNKQEKICSKNELGNVSKIIKSNTDDKIINSNKCCYCNKEFSKKSNLIRHQETACKGQLKEKEMEKELERERQIALVLAQMDKLKQELSELKQNKDTAVSIATNSNNVSNNVNSNNIINNYDIKVVAFGEENLYNRIGDEVTKKCLAKGYQSVMGLIEYVHFNKDYPELQNVFISNTRDSYAHIFDGNKWGKKRKEDVINQLFDDSQCFLIEMYKELKDKLKKADQIKFERFKNEDDINIIKEIKQEIKDYLYNYRDGPERNKIAFELERKKRQKDEIFQLI